LAGSSSLLGVKVQVKVTWLKLSPEKDEEDVENQQSVVFRRRYFIKTEALI
jgi:hypothetical protein